MTKKENLDIALVRASLAALTVYAKYPIRFALIPASNCSSTFRNKYSVLPVPGGPKIIFVFIRTAPLVVGQVKVDLTGQHLLV